VVADHAFFLLLGQGWKLPIAIWFSTAQYVVNQLQDGVCHGYQRRTLLAGMFGSEAPELLLDETVLFRGRRPGAFRQRPSQPWVASRRSAAPTFPGAPIVSGAEPSPTTQVSLRRKLFHIPSGLGQDVGGAPFLHARHGLQNLALPIQACLMNLSGDVFVDLLKLLFDKFHVR
jgi:hypothetical protein